MWKPDKMERARSRAGLPLYRQVIRLIEQGVESGLLGGGERLPSERRLGEMLGVNRSTIIRALENLADRGVLLRRQGSGTYVNAEKWGVQKYPAIKWLDMPFERGFAASGAEALKYPPAEGARDLSSGDLAADLLPSALMPESSWQEVLRQELDDEAALTGLASFKEAVLAHLRRDLGLQAQAEDLLITSGARQAFFLIAQCLLRPGDAIGIEAPSFFYSLPVFQAAGLRLFPIPTDEEGVSPDGLDMVACRRNLKMIFLNPVFQNPTGHVMGAGRKRDIFDYCAARHIPIVEDDSYSMLYFSPHTDVSPIKKLDRHGQVIYVGSLSSYMGKSVRAGWLAAPRGVARKLAGARQCIDAGLSVLPQLVGGRYLAEAREHMDFLRAELAARAAALQRELAGELGDWGPYAAPRGGFYLYLRAKGETREKSGADAAARLLKMGLIPARGAEFGGAPGDLRLNFAWFT